MPGNNERPSFRYVNQGSSVMLSIKKKKMVDRGRKVIKIA